MRVEYTGKNDAFIATTEEIPPVQIIFGAYDNLVLAVSAHITQNVHVNLHCSIIFITTTII